MWGLFRRKVVDDHFQTTAKYSLYEIFSVRGVEEGCEIGQWSYLRDVTSQYVKESYFVSGTRISAILANL